MSSPKLVILAGSNGPYSHSCIVIGRMLRMACENAGIAVGIGLDDIFARYEPLLHAGDVVYMPMELQQYTVSSGAYAAGVDGAFLLRYDRGVLVELSWRRQLGAAFCCTSEDLLEAVAEMPLAAGQNFRAETILDAQYNNQGDRIDNDLARRDEALLTGMARKVPAAGAIRDGYGAELIAGFVARQVAKGVIVVGGLPVDYDTVQFPEGSIGAVAALYEAHGGHFMILAGQSHYPRADFFNGEDHLAQPCQYMHSILVARRLATLLHRPLSSPPKPVAALAAQCPSAALRMVAN